MTKVKAELTPEEAKWINKRIDNAIEHYQHHDLNRVKHGREPEFLSTTEKLFRLKMKLEVAVHVSGIRKLTKP